jgi:hypothetical protein
MATTRRLENNVLHIEADGCIVNIREGLHDLRGRRVTSVEIIPDDRFAGEPVWKLVGTRNNRVIRLKTRPYTG